MNDITNDIQAQAEKIDKKIVKQAQTDAERWALAEAFHGEGAGNRRKLISIEMNDKMYRLPGYIEEFNKAYESLDKTKIVKRAVKERASLDRAAKAGKNLRALKRGDLRGLSTGLYVAVGVAVIAHKTGYDKKIEAEVKKRWEKVKNDHRVRKAQQKAQNVYNITNVTNDGPAKSDG